MWKYGASIVSLSLVLLASPAPVRNARITTADFPLSFEWNRGQAPRDFALCARTPGYRLLVSGAGMRLQTEAGEVRLEFVAANRRAAAEPMEALPGTVSYFLGNDPRRWVRGASTYARVRFRGVYPGVDVVVYGKQRQVEFDLVAAPGADPEKIRMRVTGVGGLRLDERGNLTARLGDSEIVFGRPFVYQETEGRRREIRAGYVLGPGNLVRFALGEWNRAERLVLDPTIQVSRFFGGSGDESLAGSAVDKDGNVYLAGRTTSPTLPGTTGQKPASTSGFLTKLSADLKNVLFTTFFGPTGSQYFQVSGVAVDDQGSAYVAGSTSAASYPTTAGAFQTSLGSGTGGYVTKFNPSGTGMTYSTFVRMPSGGGGVVVTALSLLPSNQAAIVGYTSSGFPVTANAAQPAYGGGGLDGFLAVVNGTGSALSYGTYIGGSLSEFPEAVAPIPVGGVLVGGATYSNDLRVMPPQSGDPPARSGTFSSVPLYYRTGPNEAWQTGATGGYGIRQFSTDPQNSCNVLAAAFEGGVLGSTDCGRTWQPKNSGLPSGSFSRAVSAVAYHPRTAQTAYAFDGTTFFSTTNGGGTWTQGRGVGPATPNAIVFDPANPATVYAPSTSFVSTVPGLWRSTNSGADWAPAPGQPSSNDIRSMVFDRNSASTVWLGTAQGVFKSANSGATYTPANTGLNANPDVSQLVQDGLSRLWAVTDQGLYRSTDGGATWRVSLANSALPQPAATAVPTRLGAVSRNTHAPHATGTRTGGAGLLPMIFALALWSANPQSLYALTNVGIQHSSDGGDSWKPDAGPDPPTKGAHKVATTSGNNMIAGTDSQADGFVQKYAPTGALADSMFLGGAGDDSITSVAARGDEVVVAAAIDVGTRLQRALLLRMARRDCDPSTYAALVALNGGISALALGQPSNLPNPALVFGGNTSSPSLGVTPNAPQTAPGGSSDGVMGAAVFPGPCMAAIELMSYIGGSSNEWVQAAHLLPDGSSVFTGQTTSSDFPTRNAEAKRPSERAAGAGGQEVFVVKLAPPVTVPLTASTNEVNVRLPQGPEGFTRIVAVSAGGQAANYTAVSDRAWLTVNPASGSLPARLALTVRSAGLARGEHIGIVSVYSSDSVMAIVVRLTVTGAAEINVNAVLHGASYEHEIVPAGWFVVQGTNLAATTRTWRSEEIVDGVLPTSLDDVRVYINGKEAYLYYISPTQINGQAPDDTTDGPVLLEVIRGGVHSNGFTVRLRPVSPAFFLFLPHLYIAARHADFRIVAKPDMFPGCNDPVQCPVSEAAPNEIILLYATGLGATNPVIPAGRLVDRVAIVVLPVRVRFGQTWVTAVGALSSAGLFQVNVRVPADVPDGDVEVVMEVGGIVSPPGTKLSIKRP